MKYPIVATTCFAAVLGAGSTANAGGYIGLGFGSDADLGGDLADRFTTEGASGGRFSLGQRTGPIAIEASIFGTDMTDTAGASFSTVALGVDLKYFFGLVGPIEGYGRIGLNKTWLTAESEGAAELSGRGYDFGAGLQYSFRLLPLAEAALWLDFTHQTMDLYGDSSRLTGSAEMLTLGVSIGL